MVYAGILIYTVIDNKYLFLLGKESTGRDTGLWSDFGGKIEPGETVKQAAVRECYEETMGLLGTRENLDSYIADQQPYHTFTGGHWFFLSLDYTWVENKSLIELFSRFYNYGYSLTQKEGYFEKSAISWFTLDEIANSDKMRHHFKKSLLRFFNYN